MEGWIRYDVFIRIAKHNLSRHSQQRFFSEVRNLLKGLAQTFNYSFSVSIKIQNRARACII